MRMEGVVDIMIGDQSDFGFWDSVCPTLPDFDIIYDDGGRKFRV